MKNTYFFALGTHPELSHSEIKAVLARLDFEFEIKFFSTQILIIETKKPIDKNIIGQFGGVIKFGEIINETNKNTFNDQILLKIIPENFPKVFFGISIYSERFETPVKLGLKIKKLLKDDGIASRFVTSKENPLSSVVVKKNKLTEDNGVEIILIKTAEKIYIGKTLSIQDFEKYSRIDYGRPIRDEIAGMLPPKVAQIMINLAEVKLDQTIFDPFCGNGTILQMAALLGYKNLIGSDVDENQIKSCKTNNDWLKQNFSLDFDAELKTVDARNLTKEIKPNSIDAIITEPYLGAPLRGSESEDFIKKQISELSDLYKKSFEQFEKVLKKDGKVVIIIPQFKIQNTWYSFDLQSLISNLFTPSGRWQYSRQGQKVIREIYLLKKQ